MKEGRMKTVLISSIVAVFILLFSFQNCQNPPHPDEINNLSLNSAENSNSIDLKQQALTSINFIVSDSKVVTKAGNSYQINYNKIFEIDLTTGLIFETSDLNAETEKYCLSESLKNELVSILKSSQVCKEQPSLPAGTICTQALKLPYAQLFTQSGQHDLGSATDGCGNNSVDLCNDQPSLLKAYIENFKNHYLQLTCP